MIREVSVGMAIEHDSGLLEPNPFKSSPVASYNAAWAYIVEGEELLLFPTFYTVKGKGKSVPLQAWSGPRGFQKLKFPDFMTTAQDGGKVVSLTHRPPLIPGNTPGTHSY